MAKSLFKRIFGDANSRTISQLQKVVIKINALEPEFQRLSDDELRAKTTEFRERLNHQETLDDLLPEAFAAVREAGRRTIGLRHYDVQLIGGMILHQGQVVEMRTGEGKTLVATLPLYLNALEDKGAHLVTPNDYLAKFGVQWMGPIYAALGVSVSVIQSTGGRPDEGSFLYNPSYSSEDDRYQNLQPITRRAAYQANITYGTNNEFGFDYLRDNMVMDLEDATQRELNYAIIDEVDSILIDEARTPLIISGPADEPAEYYKKAASWVKLLQPEVDYEVDVRSQVVMLTEEGNAKVESMVGIPEGESIYDPAHAEILPYLDNALRAKEFFERDKKYVVRDGEIIIVDEFTGRLMHGRRYSEGLHQAIEAKERVEIRRESLTYATITFQNFFRMYDKLGGMTGTAATEEEELRKIYGLDVIILPTNVEYRAKYGDLEEQTIPVTETRVEFAGALNNTTPELTIGVTTPNVTIYKGAAEEAYFYRRLDLTDQIYKSEKAKFKAVIQEIEAVYNAGRPVLVGTTAIETSEFLARELKKHKIPHNVLNAKYHAQEAVFIAQAGRPGTVTIATNMAGRGVDILLGGNPEGLAREQLRKEGEDLTLISATEWEEVLKASKRGEDPTQKYPERWAEVLYKKVKECEADRETVYQLGGLHVIGTERHEARRIDNQLRGRAGRQGDPGSSRFYVSLEDELMRRFGGERLKPWMDRAGLDEFPLEFNIVGKVIESIQERVEGYNFDIRKHVLEYDNVVNKQREVVYAERRKILSRDDLHDDLLDIVESEIRQVIQSYTAGYEEDWNIELMLAELRKFTPIPRNVEAEHFRKMSAEEIVAQCYEWADKTYYQLNRQLGEEFYRGLREEASLKRLQESEHTILRMMAKRIESELDEDAVNKIREQPLRRLAETEEEQALDIVAEIHRLYRDRRLMLGKLDRHWVRHLTTLDMLREGIGLRAVGQQKPLVAYQKEAFDIYQDMLNSVQSEIARSVFMVSQQQKRNARPRRPVFTPRQPQLHTSGGSATATQTPQKQPGSGGTKLGRNDLCWCGSGKKYKDCHMRQDKKEGKIHYKKGDS
ncbi:MAG: preprotein translocase subunit SecA [Anaerolineae bacterium]|nr:preprotein translocase subunit SecA [Anaerolineae bacterium]